MDKHCQRREERASPWGAIYPLIVGVAIGVIWMDVAYERHVQNIIDNTVAARLMARESACQRPVVLSSLEARE